MLLHYVTWSANPEIFTLFGREIRWYGLFFAIGFLIGYKIVEWVFKREGKPQQWVDSLFIYVIVSTIVGARLGHCLFYDWAYYSTHLLDIFKIWEGGLASHGGTAAIMLGVFIYSRRVTHLSSMWTFDRLVLPVGLVAALIRMGNLMNHEIYGHVTTHAWGFRFIENINAYHYEGAAPIYTLPSHPTQIYEALAYLLTFAVVMSLYYFFNAGRRRGLLFGVFLVGIFLSRMLIEQLKLNQESFEDGMFLNMGQLLSVPFVMYGFYLIVRALMRPKEAF